jgi:serine/threonine-protein kinase
VRLGAYEVLGELARGGSGRVYRVLAPDGKIVALKLLVNTAKDVSFARFAREQKLLDRLGEAEGFVPLLDCGEAREGPFFTMPLLKGGTLRQRLAKGALQIEEVVQLARALATSIGWAHSRGIVHRDLKPENILFNARGRPLIADLGIAKYLGTNPIPGGSTSLTKQGAFLGTTGYMAPEQMISSKEVDARADVFALAVVIYECLAGRSPFEGETPAETLARTLEARHTPIEKVRIDTPKSLSHPIGIALTADATYRYKDGFTFAASLGAQLPQMMYLKPTEKERPRETTVVRAAPSRLPLRALWLLALLVPPVAAILGVGARLGNRASDAAPPTPPPLPKIVAPAPKGWFGEALPPNVRLGSDRPIYLYDTTRGLELEFVYVPPGDFLMGAINGGPDEKPLHTHSIPRGYYIARTEVTWDQYRAFCWATRRSEPTAPSWPITGSHPVVNVSWFDAVAFCEWAGLSLPGEAEWEKAARGGGVDTRQWPWGDEWVPGSANVADLSFPDHAKLDVFEPIDDGFPYTSPVASFPMATSPYGALDMAGNVFQWCAEWFDSTIYTDYSNGRTDPPSTGKDRVARGGCYSESRFLATTSQRRPFNPEVGDTRVGFRPCLRTK